MDGLGSIDLFDDSLLPETIKNLSGPAWIDTNMDNSATHRIRPDGDSVDSIAPPTYASHAVGDAHVRHTCLW